MDTSFGQICLDGLWLVLLKELASVPSHSRQSGQRCSSVWVNAGPGNRSRWPVASSTPAEWKSSITGELLLRIHSRMKEAGIIDTVRKDSHFRAHGLDDFRGDGPIRPIEREDRPAHIVLCPEGPQSPVTESCCQVRL